jgi:putative transcriptional regulator
MELENCIKQCRVKKGNITQEELAKKIGVSRQTIISIEKGRFVPSTILALKIAAVFKQNVESIFFLK